MILRTRLSLLDFWPNYIVSILVLLVHMSLLEFWDFDFWLNLSVLYVYMMPIMHANPLVCNCVTCSRVFKVTKQKANPSIKPLGVDSKINKPNLITSSIKAHLRDHVETTSKDCLDTKPNGYIWLHYDIDAISLLSLPLPLELEEDITHYKLANCWNVAWASLQGTTYPWVCNPSSETKWWDIVVQRTMVCKHGLFGHLWSHECALHIKQKLRQLSKGSRV